MDLPKDESPVDQNNLEDMEEEKQSTVALYAKKIGSNLLGMNVLVFLFINRYSAWIRRHLLFSHFARWPLFADLSKSEKYGIDGVRNFYLHTKDEVRVGVWQILPQSMIKTEGNSEDYFAESFGDGKPIILYVHGNSGTRATPHRVKLYKRFQQQEYHTVTFDYRSYGDSTPVTPDEVGVVEDAKTVITWVLKHKKSSPVFVWGHSLGTGVSSRLLKELEEDGIFVDGLVLESPFNNLCDELKEHPLALPLKYMIGFDYFLVNPLLATGISFRSDEYLAQCRVPVLILHGEDDWVVPFKLGKRLYRYLLKNKAQAAENVRFLELGIKNGGYGHKYICDCPSLMSVVGSFMEKKYNDIPSHVD